MRRLSTEDKLLACRAEKQALKEEIQGLHLYINKLLGELGRTPIFKATQTGEGNKR